MSHHKILLALDVPTLDDARRDVEELAPYVGGIKIGLELVTAVGGPQLVREVRKEGLRLMYDTKFCDISNTVGAAVREVDKLGADFYTVMASAGADSLKAAAGAQGKARGLAVTVLTTFDEAQCYRTFGKGVSVKVEEFTYDAFWAGIPGIVCSAKDLAFLRATRARLECMGQWNETVDFTRMLKVTPGIRPVWAAANDQKRIATPTEAIKDGANYLVIGRPILKPPAHLTRIEAAQLIADEIAEALP